MEVYHSRIGIVRDASGFQVDAQHIGRPNGHPLEDEPPRGFVGQPTAQAIG